MNVSDSNFDALIKVASDDLLNEDIELANSIDVTKTVVSKKAKCRIYRTMKNYDKESLWSSIPFTCRRIIAAVLVACTISF